MQQYNIIEACTFIFERLSLTISPRFVIKVNKNAKSMIKGTIQANDALSSSL
jgi:hypothetical protein